MWDAVVLTAAALLILGYSFFVSRHRLLWSDELFGWMLVDDPSWRHMFRAWNLGADGGGAGFYILCRLWLAIFGHSLVAFRAFSAFGVYLGFAAVWLALRQYYRPLLVALALPTVWFGSPSLLWHMVQTRFYGLMVGACGLALLAMLRSTAEIDRTGRLRWRTLAAVSAANLLLVSSHPFGAAYSLLLLVCAALDDLRTGRKRMPLYVASLLPWTALLFSTTAIRNSQRVGKPWFWTTRPTWGDLVQTYRPAYLGFGYVTAFLLAVLLISLLRRGPRNRFLAGCQQRMPLLIVGVCFLLVPLVFWVFSQRGTSYFVERYFCPFTFGVAILGTELLWQVFPAMLDLHRPVPFALTVCLAVFVAEGCLHRTMLRYAHFLTIPEEHDSTGELAALLPRHVPVVIQRTDLFDVMVYYRLTPDLPMVYPLDWPLALSARSPRWLVSADHEMENWKRAGYFANQVVDSAIFLRSHNHFIAVVDPDTPWFKERVERDPTWHLHRLATFRRNLWSAEIWDVSR